jgi:hypothetical protein
MKTLPLWLMGLLGVSPYLAHGGSRGADVTYRGPVTQIQQSAGGLGSVAVRLAGFDLTAKINPETEIELNGDDAGLSGLCVGDFVKISGFFSESGIIAKEIEIHDSEASQWRLRGPITELFGMPDTVNVTVLNVTFLVDSSTRIERRGSQEDLNPSDLAVGIEVDARGAILGSELWAARLKIGNRDDDDNRVRFEGKIVSMDNSLALIDTEGGGLAVVRLNSSTIRKGSLHEGERVEVKGTLNEQLEVVAVILKAEGADDDDPPNDDPPNDDPPNDDPPNDDNQPLRIEQQIALHPTQAGARIQGEAKIEFEADSGGPEQEFEVEIEKALPNTEYRILVMFTSSQMIDVGSLATDAEGRAKVKFRTEPRAGERDIDNFLPAGADVRDISIVQVTLNGTVVLEGQF